MKGVATRNGLVSVRRGKMGSGWKGRREPKTAAESTGPRKSAESERWGRPRRHLAAPRLDLREMVFGSFGSFG